MDLEEAMGKIRKEYLIAEQARQAGNSGMVRVCARRAAGVAIGYWLGAHPHPDWGADAMTRLRSVVASGAIPPPVREAAERLTAKITGESAAKFPANPLADARLLVTHFTGQTL